MPGNILVDCVDQHLEIPPPGGAVLVPHRFQSRPTAEAKFITVAGGHPLTEGDRFRNESIPDHSLPMTGGAFAVGSPSQEGSFTAAGQSLVRINGRPWMTIAGQMETCSDAVGMRSVASGVTPQKRSMVTINDNPAITGW